VVSFNFDAHGILSDYTASATRLADVADYLVVNVSSPNTPGLRNLQAVLEEAGSGLDGALKTTVFLTDLGTFGAVGCFRSMTTLFFPAFTSE